MIEQEKKLKIVCAILTNAHNIIPTADSTNDIAEYLSVPIPTSEKKLFKLQQKYIACYVSELADQIIRAG